MNTVGPIGRIGFFRHGGGVGSNGSDTTSQKEEKENDTHKGQCRQIFASQVGFAVTILVKKRNNSMIRIQVQHELPLNLWSCEGDESESDGSIHEWENCLVIETGKARMGKESMIW